MLGKKNSKLIDYIHVKTGLSKTIIKEILEAERQYYLKTLMYNEGKNNKKKP